MKITSTQAELNTIMAAANNMAAAARTAPKTCGEDSLEVIILTGDDKDELCEAMYTFAKERSMDFVVQDANNIKECPCIVLIGIRREYIGLANCGLCGFENCGVCAKSGATCSFKIVDLGIAVGSAAGIAADQRIDNRVMYSAGAAAVAMGLFSDSVANCYGIPLSATCKNPFFDRAEQLGEIITAR